MSEQIQFPISLDWSTEEVVEVMKMWELVEQAYIQKVDIHQLQEQYRRFKEIVPSKSEEKQLGNAFEEATGCSLYRVIQAMKDQQGDWLMM